MYFVVIISIFLIGESLGNSREEMVKAAKIQCNFRTFQMVEHQRAQCIKDRKQEEEIRKTFNPWQKCDLVNDLVDNCNLLYKDCFDTQRLK